MTDAQSHQDWSPEEWLSDLKDKLQIAGDGYLRCRHEEDDAEEHPDHVGIRATRTAFAMLSVGTIMKKLGEIPGMNEHSGLVPLHDLVAALWELGRGGQPALLQPTPGVGRGGESVSDRWVRQHALLFVSMLEDAGMKGRPACRVVAKMMADEGHVGRKRHDGPRPLSEGTIVDWRNRSRQRDFAKRDPEAACFLDRTRDRMRATASWPCTEAQAVELISKMVKSNLMHSKSG